jgi:dephospho-CoA kinase
MLKIGLTGGIGSGKSFIGEIFRHLNVPVYEADKEARRLMESDALLIESIKNLLGKEAYRDGNLNRTFIGNIVFSNPSALNSLNSLVHPAVQKDFERWSRIHIDQAYVIEEAAILFESGSAEKMDYVVFIRAALETRIERTMARDSVSREDVLMRIRQQADDTEKEIMADFTIINENDSMILPQIVDLHQKFINLNKV